jgi:uncharacterized protein with HEPN domain
LTKGQTLARLGDIVDAIDQIDLLLSGKTVSDLQSDRVMKAAYERFLEILSEASRHIDASQKSVHPEIPWRRIADLGNHIRHAYQHIDTSIIWSLYVDGDVDRLRTVTVQLIESVKKSP